MPFAERPGAGEHPAVEQEKLSTTLLISGFVRNESTLTADFAAGAGAEQVMPKYGELL
ncbi:MAG: hypothetical protein QOD91_502, partial [Frankiales bacterium]|nr:hypothetical protein [Frankiales bacterium]